jgi:hypothetical protein
VWAALNAANYAMTSVQENVTTGLTSLAVTVSTNRVIHVAFLSNFRFQSGQTWYYFHIFSTPIQTISFFLYHKVSSDFINLIHFHFIAMKLV